MSNTLTLSTTRFQNLSLNERIRHALPIAREQLGEGINSRERTELTIVDRVARLLGDRSTLAAEYHNAGEDRASELWDRLEAARALGIALGLLLRQETFEG
jgi:hypothetical protein